MLTQTELKTIAGKIPQNSLETPYMLTDLTKFTEKCQQFRKVFPGIQLYYAVKSFSDDEVIKHMDPLLDGYDVASLAEIRQLSKLGIAPSRMTYSNPVKSLASIKEAVKLGVGSFAYQSREELEKIKQCTDKKSVVYLRIKVSDEASELSFSSKFGCEPDEAVDLLMAAQELDLDPQGLTFHVGSQATFSGVWDKALERVAHIKDQVKKQGIEIKFINLGGGFPVQYSTEHPTLEDVGEVVNTSLQNPNLHLDGLVFLAEPGRFLSADSSVIITTVIGVEKRAGTTWLFLDVGSFQAFVEIFEFNYFPYPVYSLRHLREQPPTTKHERYVLTGPSCDSFDTLSTAVDLPADIVTGDQLMVTMTGSYTVVYGSAFNGFQVPPRTFIK